MVGINNTPEEHILPPSIEERGKLERNIYGMAIEKVVEEGGGPVEYYSPLSLLLGGESLSIGKEKLVKVRGGADGTIECVLERGGRWDRKKIETEGELGVIFSDVVAVRISPDEKGKPVYQMVDEKGRDLPPTANRLRILKEISDTLHNGTKADELFSGSLKKMIDQIVQESCGPVCRKLGIEAITRKWVEELTQMAKDGDIEEGSLGEYREILDFLLSWNNPVGIKEVLKTGLVKTKEGLKAHKGMLGLVPLEALVAVREPTTPEEEEKEQKKTRMRRLLIGMLSVIGIGGMVATIKYPSSILESIACATVTASALVGGLELTDLDEMRRVRALRQRLLERAIATKRVIERDKKDSKRLQENRKKLGL